MEASDKIIQGNPQRAILPPFHQFTLSRCKCRHSASKHRPIKAIRSDRWWPFEWLTLPSSNTHCTLRKLFRFCIFFPARMKLKVREVVPFSLERRRSWQKVPFVINNCFLFPFLHEKWIFLFVTTLVMLNEVNSLAIPLSSSAGGSYHSPYSGYMSSHMGSYSSGYKRPTGGFSAALTSSPLLSTSSHYGYSGYPGSLTGGSSFDFPTAYDSGYEVHGTGYYWFSPLTFNSFFFVSPSHSVNENNKKQNVTCRWSKRKILLSFTRLSHPLFTSICLSLFYPRMTHERRHICGSWQSNFVYFVSFHLAFGTQRPSPDPITGHLMMKHWGRERDASWVTHLHCVVLCFSCAAAHLYLFYSLLIQFGTFSITCCPLIHSVIQYSLITRDTKVTWVSRVRERIAAREWN